MKLIVNEADNELGTLIYEENALPRVSESSRARGNEGYYLLNYFGLLLLFFKVLY